MVFGLGMGITFSDILPEPLGNTVAIIFIGIGLIFFLIAKKFISQPRLGVVKFGFKRKRRKLKTVVVLSINSIILLIIYLILFLNPDLRIRFPAYLDGLIIGLLFVTLPVCFAAYFLQYSRLYFIGILVGLSFFLSELFGFFIPEPFDALIVFTLVSGTIIIFGIISLIKFIRKYPLPKEEVN